MTKEEFIKQWCDTAGFPEDIRTPDGLRFSEYPALELIAVPCDCGMSICQGWRITNKLIAGMYGIRPISTN